MRSIIFAMQQCKLRSALNKWVRTMRELDALEDISEDLWGKGSRALVRVGMLRRDLEGNLQLVLGKIRNQVGERAVSAGAAAVVAAGGWWLCATVVSAHCELVAWR